MEHYSRIQTVLDEMKRQKEALLETGVATGESKSELLLQLAHALYLEVSDIETVAKIILLMSERERK